MFDHQYVPVLRTKEGEFRALEALAASVSASVIPLFEVSKAPINQKAGLPKPEHKHIDDVSRDVIKATEAFSEIWIDDKIARPERIPETSDSPHARLFEALSDHPAIVVPVISTHRSAHYLAAAQDHARKTGRLAVRITSEFIVGPNAADRLKAVCDSTGISASGIDLVLDVEPFNSSQKTVTFMGTVQAIRQIPALAEWRTFTLATTALPEQAAQDEPNDSTFFRPRSCWLMWQDLLSSPEVSRKPRFGDYGIDSPATDLDRTFYGAPVPMIRYTIPEHWVFFRGSGKPKNSPTRATDWPQLSRRLLSSGHFRGPDYSAGDRFIQECADGAPNHGGGSAWRFVGVSHHVTQVVEQLTNLPLS